MRTPILFVAALVTLASAICAQAQAQETEKESQEKLSGEVIVLGSGHDSFPESETAEINVRGLVIVQIDDAGSASVEDVEVDAGQAFRQLGCVRGVRMADGEPQMGGGYTWCLMQAVNEADKAEIKVAYKEADHVGGETKEVKHQVSIVPLEQD